MKILHTADWHIGQTLNGWSREYEHGRFLASLAELVEKQEADALIVAGDIFDGINPSAESLSLFYRALIDCRKRRPHLSTVIIAGNHDPAGRLEAPDVVLREIGVRVAGTLQRRDGAIDLARHLVPLADAKGVIRAFVLAIPFLRAADLPGFALVHAENGVSPVVEATRRLYREAVDSALPHTSGLPLLATGHLHCAGGEESEGAERRILLGGEHAVPHDVFPEEICYVALGHLHRAQKVGRDCVRYSGSPFPLSATELNYDHGVRLVELGENGLASEHLRIARPAPCIRIPERGAAPLAALAPALSEKNYSAETPIDQRPFVHLVIAPEGPIAGLDAEIDRILEHFPVRCAGKKIVRPDAQVGVDVQAAASLSETKPAELFEDMFTRTHGCPPGPEHKAAFLEAEQEN